MSGVEMAAAGVHLAIDSVDPAERGRQRGRALAPQIADAFDVYLRLFAAAGITSASVSDSADRLADAVADWSPTIAEELVGVAAGAGLQPWQIVALNGRTEILATAGTAPECSTLVLTGQRTRLSPLGIQTWDWHRELSGYWHTQSVRGTAQGYVGLAESGMLAKIGMNEAGLGLFFNILAHYDDAATGVPIHLLAARILAEATSVSEAVDLIRSTPMASSGALTLLDAQAVVCAEVSPVGVSVLEPADGYLVHTNHFLAAGNAAGAKPASYEPDSRLRQKLLDTRMSALTAAPTSPRGLAELLRSGPADPQLCCVPDPDAALGEGWATLATVVLNADDRTASIRRGSPNDHADFLTLGGRS